MQRTCDQCLAPFIIPDDELAFLEKMTFIFGNVKVHPPLPTKCPDCRCQIRTAHRNERFLFRRRSNASGKDIVSLYAEEPPWGEPWNVFEQEYWRSDAWDPMSYGREIDFIQPFFSQFVALQKDVPRMALVSIGNENSEFTTGTGYCKNCYIINSSEHCEDCYYGKLFQKCRSCVDCHYIYGSELCYECFSVYDSYHCQYLAFSNNCSDCFYSAGLRGCRNCCFCTNLSNKEYYFDNQQLSKEEYVKRIGELQGSYRDSVQAKERWKQLMSGMIHKYANIVDSDNCTGDYIEHSRNCLDCYDVNESEDCRYVQVGVNVKDNYHCSNMYLKPELCYDTLGTIEVYNVAYCLFIFHSKNMLYCDYCFNCSDCFGCTGLTRKQYCIFNKQYTKEQYDEIVPKLIASMESTGEWGEFFPVSFSPFAYNETLAAEYYPITKTEVFARGWHWREKNDRDYRAATVELPDTIDDATDALIQEVLACAKCSKNYRIIPQELSFYREQGISLPRMCPDCRYDERLTLRNPRKLYSRICAKCGKGIHSTYASDRTEVVYCESCYHESVV